MGDSCEEGQCDGAVYSEAVDPVEFDRVYTETDILIDGMKKEGETK